MTIRVTKTHEEPGEARYRLVGGGVAPREITVVPAGDDQVRVTTTGLSDAERVAVTGRVRMEDPTIRRVVFASEDTEVEPPPAEAATPDLDDAPAPDPEESPPSAPEPTPAPAPQNRGGTFPRWVVVVGGLAAAVVVLAGVRELRELIGPFFLALNLIIAAYPIKRALTRWGLPAWVGAVATGLTVFLVLVAFFGSLGWAIAALVDRLPAYRAQFTQLYEYVLRTLSSLGISEQQLEASLRTFDPSNLLGLAQSALSGASSLTSLLIIVLTVLVFLVADSITIPSRLELVRHYQPSLGAALESFAVGVRRYWVVTTIFGLIVAVIDLGALLVLGVPLAFVWAVVSFVTNYIPNIGFVIGLVPPALIALLANGPVSALLVVIIYSVANFVVQSIIQPKFTGDAVGVTATVSFLSLLFWASILGALGALLALPATLLVKAIFIDSDPQMRWVNAFIAAKNDPIGADGEPTAPAVA